jgi:hypothetical protein
LYAYNKHSYTDKRAPDPICFAIICTLLPILIENSINNGYVTWITPDAEGLLDLEPRYNTQHFFFPTCKPLFTTTFLEFALDWNRLEGRRVTKARIKRSTPSWKIRLYEIRLD